MSTFDELSWLFFGWLGVLLGVIIGWSGPSTFGGVALMVLIVVLHLFFAIRVQMIFDRYKKLLKETTDASAG